MIKSNNNLNVDMRTTIRIDSALLLKAKKVALNQGNSLTKLFEEALSSYLLNNSKKPTKNEKIDLPSFKGDGLCPGVNIDNSAELSDIMDNLK